MGGSCPHETGKIIGIAGSRAVMIVNLGSDSPALGRAQLGDMAQQQKLSRVENKSRERRRPPRFISLAADGGLRRPIPNVQDVSTPVDPGFFQEVSKNTYKIQSIQQFLRTLSWNRAHGIVL